jgi:hypothetical protein
VRTVQSWLSVLESTFVLFRLQPFHQNFRKRVIKSPKLYFLDTGLVCALLNIKTSEEFNNSHFKGALVENFIVSECLKNNINQHSGAQLFYWRENNGVEIDLIVELKGQIQPVEIKSAQTYSRDFSLNLKKFMAYSGTTTGTIVYTGNQSLVVSDGLKLMNWAEFLKN